MLKENVRIAKDVLDGMSLDAAAEKHGKSRARCWQVTLAFCLEYFLHHESHDESGKVRDLKGLRHSWKHMLEY